MERKGQAAMEFLMTYGWAILAAVIVIGVLASFGVFSPSKYVPTSCSLSAPFGCDKNQIAAATDNIQFVIRNGAGESMNIVSVAITGCGTNSSVISLADQGTSLVYIPCSPALITGSKFSGSMTVTYSPATGGLLNMTSAGSITAEVA